MKSAGGCRMRYEPRGGDGDLFLFSMQKSGDGRLAPGAPFKPYS